MEEILYIPGFREAETKRMPGVILGENYTTKNKLFSRVILPGDIKNNDPDTLFSMSGVQDSFIKILNGLERDTTVITYSLSAFPVLEAIHSLTSEVQKKVAKVIFIHPAKNPLFSVSMMDWCLGGNNNPYEGDYYVKGDNKEIFKTLIGDWRGDAERFQEDLLRYQTLTSQNRRYFDARVLELKDIIGCVKVIDSAEDMIVFPQRELDFTKKGLKHKAYMSHIPVFSPEILQEIFS